MCAIRKAPRSPVRLSAAPMDPDLVRIVAEVDRQVAVVRLFERPADASWQMNIRSYDVNPVGALRSTAHGPSGRQRRRSRTGWASRFMMTARHEGALIKVKRRVREIRTASTETSLTDCAMAGLTGAIRTRIDQDQGRSRAD